MKKLTAFFLAVSLLLGLTSGFADDNWGTETLNEAETAGIALAMILGEPLLITVEMDDTYDAVNARFVFIGNEAMGCDLGVAIRISETQMYFWSMELTPANLIKAKLVLDEEAPLCSVLYYEGNELKDYALYHKKISSMSYEDFMKKVDSFTASLASGDMGESAGGADPILACFPGISWGMTRDDMLSKADKGMFSEVNSEAGTSLLAKPEIYGETVKVLFIFGDDNKVSMITAIHSEEKMTQYLSALTQAYGTPRQTTFMGALTGQLSDIEDDPNGDCYAWKTSKSLIILDSNAVQYWPLY